MSFAALAWAGKCKPGSASRKLVLMALADRHNDEVDGSYPSIAWLVEFTDLNRKTIINCLTELEAMGFISDSGERKGNTKQIKLYRLHIETIPKAEQFQKRNSTAFSGKESQKRDTDTVREPVPSGAKAPSGKARASKTPIIPDWVPAEQWKAFVAMRRTIRKPLSDHAITLAISKLKGLADDGYPPGAVLDQSTLNCWQDLYKIKEDRNARTSSIPSPIGQPVNELAQAAMRRVEQSRMQGVRN